jgi:hypothetical protein
MSLRAMVYRRVRIRQTYSSPSRHMPDLEDLVSLRVLIGVPGRATPRHARSALGGVLVPLRDPEVHAGEVPAAAAA